MIRSADQVLEPALGELPLPLLLGDQLALGQQG
jgi:hypothetical protein